jgi:hypothetical protein
MTAQLGQTACWFFGNLYEGLVKSRRCGGDRRRMTTAAARSRRRWPAPSGSGCRRTWAYQEHGATREVTDALVAQLG